MPALPSVPKVLRVVLNQHNQGDTRVQDRFYLQYSGAGPAVADLNTLIATISTAWLNNLAPLVNALGGLDSIAITDLTSSTGAFAQGGTARVGTRSGAMTMAIAAVVQFKIARRYRGGHPRFYLDGGANTDVTTGGLWTTAFQSAVSSGFAAFIAAIQTTPPAALGTLSHVNVSYYQGFTVVTNPITHRARNVPTLRATPIIDTISTYACNPHVGSQRRRNLQSP